MNAVNSTIAKQFIEAQLQRRQFEAAPDGAPATAKDAYQVQEEVYAALFPQQLASAWKVGGPKPDVEPTAAPIPGTRLLTSPARLQGKDFHMLGIEVEIAYRLAHDLPPRTAPYTAAEIAAAISEALVTIELCDTRLANWKTASALWRLADFQLNAALIAGSGVQDWQRIDFTKQRAELWVDGKLAIEATGVHPYGNPIGLMPWLTTHNQGRCGGLRAGNIITTGTWTGMHFVAPGSEIVARFPGIGEAQLSIAS